MMKNHENKSCDMEKGREQNVAKKIVTSFMDGTYVGIEVRGLPPAKMNFPVS